MRHRLLEQSITDLKSAKAIIKIIKELDPACGRVVVSADAQQKIRDELRMKYVLNSHALRDGIEGWISDFVHIEISGIVIHGK